MIFVFSILCIICAYGVLSFALIAHAETTSEIKPESTQDMIARIAKSYGQDPELAIAIAHCESKTSQASIGKNYHEGEVWSSDIGLFQINDYYHDRTADKMGIDIYTTRGNIVYAMQLMQKQGTTPWKSSKSCWSKLV